MADKEGFLFKNTPIDFSYKNLELDPLFFTKLTAEGFRRSELNLKQHHIPALYLSGILESFANKSMEYNSIETYVIDLYETIKRKPEKNKQLKIKFADNIVFYNGIFQERRNKLTDPSFYNKLAKNFYYTSSFVKDDLYYSLAYNLEDYLEVLHEVSYIIQEFQDKHL